MDATDPAAAADPSPSAQLSDGEEARRLEARFGPWLGHPKGLTFLFFAEMWERFSFYGMRALLFPFMLDRLRLSNDESGWIYGAYTGGAYMTGIIGGLVSDRALGQRRAMLAGGIMMVVGHLTMALPTDRFFFAALALIAIGTGFFKPNSASLVGRLYHPDDRRRERAFGLYYLGVNIGSFLAIIICGYLGERVGWHAGFAAAGVGMTFGLLAFASGRAHFGSLGSLAHASKRPAATPPLGAKERDRVLAVLILGLMGNLAFWSTFEQAGSSLNLFAVQSTRLDIRGFALPPAWLQATNPIFIILLTPVFTWGWRRLQAAQREPSAVVKFAAALALVCVGFVVMCAAGSLVDEGLQRVSIVWLVGAYFFHTLGELMLAPVGLSVVSRLAPARHASLLMSLWFAVIALADLLGGFWAGKYTQLSKLHFFSVPAVTAATAALALWAVRRPLTRLMHLEPAAGAGARPAP